MYAHARINLIKSANAYKNTFRAHMTINAHKKKTQIRHLPYFRKQHKSHQQRSVVHTASGKRQEILFDGRCVLHCIIRATAMNDENGRACTYAYAREEFLLASVSIASKSHASHLAICSFSYVHNNAPGADRSSHVQCKRFQKKLSITEQIFRKKRGFRLLFLLR